MKFELSRFFELEGKTYDISYAIDKYIESDRYKHGINYGEIFPIANERDHEDWATVHKDLGENRIFKFENINKEGDKYFVEIYHPMAVKLLQTGDCKFSKRSFIDFSGSVPEFEIITLDIVFTDEKAYLMNNITLLDYKLDKIKEGTWFDNKVRIKYFSLCDDDIAIGNYINNKEFVILEVNDMEVFKGDIKSLLYGGIIKPDMFNWFLRYLDVKGDKVTPENELRNFYTDYNLLWFTPETCYKSIFDYKGLELKNNRYKCSNNFNLNIFTTTDSRTKFFAISNDDNRNVIEWFDDERLALNYIRDEVKISVQDYMKLSKDINKNLHLKDRGKNTIYIIPYLKEDISNKVEKLHKLADSIPDRDTSIVHKSANNLDTDLIFYFKNKVLNKFKVLGEVEEYKECIYIGVPNSSYKKYILVSKDMKDIFVTIPSDVLEDRYDINIIHDKNSEYFAMMGRKPEFSLENCKNMFTPLYDIEDKRLFICVNVKDTTVFNLSGEILGYIDDKYGKYLYECDIEALCRQFLENVEENTRIFNSIDRQELGEYFGLHFDGELEEYQDDIQILDELIKIRRYLLNK